MVSKASIRARLSSVILMFAIGSGALLVAGCTADLDRQKETLEAQVEEERSKLSTNAQKGDYYVLGPDKDFQVETSKQPVTDLFDSIAKLDAGDRIVGFQSVRSVGTIQEWWTRCWPFHSRMGAYIKLFGDDALQGAFYLDRPSINSWTTHGVRFDLGSSAGIGGALLTAGVEYCVGSADVGVIPVVAVFPPCQNLKGSVGLNRTDEGLEYAANFDRAPYVFIGACVAEWCLGWPIRMDKPVLTGTIRNIVGKSGEVKIKKTNRERKYTLDIKFNEARFLDGGLAASGPIVINWTNP